MRKSTLCFLLLLPFISLFSQAGLPASTAGRYAGTKKSLIGNIYTDSHNITGLSGWTFREGNVVNSLNDHEMITVDVFQKGTTYIVLFSIKEDTASEEFKIMDVLEIKNVTTAQQIATAFCRDNKNENAEIVALIKPGNTEYSKALRAWRLNRDKRRIEIKNIKGIDCLNEGFDQH
jgi:hypothetical protein